jgi:NRPS condensation-like uncharacterized protein
MLKEDTNTNDFWLRLDNAAKIYPAIKDRELTSVFRVGVELKERIKARQLLEAVHEIEERFPYYKVKLKAGVFWYYLEPCNLPIAVEADLETPCRAFEKDELMFRVLARKNELSVEFSHILTDASGALEFLKTILFRYFEKCCQSLPSQTPSLHARETPSPEEYEDAYNRYFKKIDSQPAKIPKAFHIPFHLKNAPRFDVLTAIISTEDIKTRAKEYEVSLTEYLAAVYMYALQNVYNQLTSFQKKISNKIIRIEVPVNLRKLFPSRTMRNFSLYVMPEIDLRLGHYTFEEIVKTIHYQMQLQTDRKLISKMISRNVGGEKNPFIRGVPLFIKSLILSKLYTAATTQYSGVVTNLGKISLAPSIDKMINKFSFIPPPPNKMLKVNCAVAGFDNTLVITFGNITASKELERHFLTFLTSQGIPVKIV